MNPLQTILNNAKNIISGGKETIDLSKFELDSTKQKISPLAPLTIPKPKTSEPVKVEPSPSAVSIQNKFALPGTKLSAPQTSKLDAIKNLVPKQLTRGLVGEGYVGQGKGDKAKFDTGLLGFIRPFGLGKPIEQKVIERQEALNPLVSAGLISPLRAKEISEEPLVLKGLQATSRGLNPTPEPIKLSKEEKDVLRPILREEALDKVFGAFDVLGFAGPIKNVGKKIVGETVDFIATNRNVQEISAKLINDLNIDKKVAEEIAPSLVNLENKQDVSRVIDTIISPKTSPKPNDLIDEQGFMTKTDNAITPIDVVKKSEFPIAEKVNLIDYFRTPIKVLEKIGLGKEGALVRKKFDDYLNELPKQIDRITEWSNRLPKESNVRLFKYLDGQNIELTDTELKVAGEIKDYLKSWADRLGLPEDDRIANYITHIFEDQLIKKEFDDDLAKIIDKKIPGSVYNPFLEKRLGADGYIQDVWKALDAYTKRAVRKVHMDEALSAIQKKAGILEQSQFNYVKRYADRVNLRPTEFDKIVDNGIKQIVGYRFGQRPVAVLSSLMRRMTYRGLLGLNLGSALRNLSQGINTYAKLGEKYTTIGYLKLLDPSNHKELIDQNIFNQGFIQDRHLTSTKKAIEKIDKGLFYFFEMAERINRGSAYFGAKAKGLAKGMSEAEAIEYGKNMVKETQFSFGSVDTPVALSSDLMKTTFQLQNFTTKQIEFLTDMFKKKEFAGLLRYSLSGILFVYTIGKAIGMEPKELLPVYRLGIPPSLKAPFELGKALLGTKDKYGNERDLSDKTKDVVDSLTGVVPAGAQIKKTITGLEASQKGFAENRSGDPTFRVEGASKIKAPIFGIYSTQNAKEYVKGGFKSTYIKTKEELTNEIEQKLQSGEFGSVAVANEYYKKEIAKIKNIQKSNRLYLPEDEFKAALDSLVESKELTVKEANEEWEDYQDQSKSEKRGKLKTALVYAQAFVVDPQNAWKALWTKEKIGDVKGEIVTLKRFFDIPYNAKGGSEEYKKEVLAQMGIPSSQSKNYKLEHIIPVGTGGDNSPINLVVVDNKTHNSYTPLDNVAVEAARSGRLTRKQITDIMIAVKVDKTMTVQEAIKLLK